MKSFLSGSPEVRIGLNEDLDFGETDTLSAASLLGQLF